MPNTCELYRVTHSSPEIKTVGDYLFDVNSPAKEYLKTPELFLNVVGDDGLTNRKRIENTFRTPEEKRFIGIEANKLPLKVGTILYIEYEKVNQATFVTDGFQVVSTDDVAFKAAKLAELESDQGYVQVNKPISGYIQTGSLKEMYPDVTVWIWCRSLSPRQDEDSELTGEFFNLTPFIGELTTNMGKNGGNFQITLPPIVCELNSDNKWSLSKASITQYENTNASSLQGQGYVAESSLFRITDSLNGSESLEPNKFLFHNMVRPNDLIFIRFETLNIEKQQRYADAKRITVDKSNIANRIYDMIGLVDSNIQTTNPSSNDVSISINGRDLSKLFIEDGTYFYALENSQGMLKFAGQSTQKNSMVNRIFANGALSFIGLYQMTSIEHIFKFILQQLSNIRVVPDNLFTSYAHSKKIENGVLVEYDGRNDRFNESNKELKIDAKGNKLKQPKFEKQYTREKSYGIWQIVKLVIDNSVSERRLADSSFSTAQGSLLNFFRSAAQEPLVEYYSDTYGDQYHLIIRKPPYDQKALISLIEGKVNTEDGTQITPPAIIDIQAEDVLMERLSMDDSQVYSWYHFFPKMDFFGNAGEFSLSYLGALFFEEYAQVFGSKPFQQSHPYLPFLPQQNNQGGSLDVYEKQAISDLKYVVECNQALPFLRKGALTLNGDRRFKIGNVIRYKPTGEIFFIDSVQQTFKINNGNIERTTTLHVSRGMVEQLIYGVHLKDDEGVTRFVSYFNLIDTRLEFKNKMFETTETVKKKVGTKTVFKNIVSLAPLPTDINALSILPEGILQNPDMIKGLAYLENYNEFPNNKNIFIRFLNGITALGYNVRLTPLSTHRTYLQQAALKVENANNASAGSSTHEQGTAIDISIVDSRTGKNYSKTTSEQEWRITGVPQLANRLGLQWGGGSNNGTFGNYIDRVHFQLLVSKEKTPVTEDVFEEVKQTKKTMGLDRDGIFTNFKTNKFTFNFFLKNLQFDQQWRTVKSRNVYNSDKDGSLKDVTVTSKHRK